MALPRRATQKPRLALLLSAAALLVVSAILLATRAGDTRPLPPAQAEYHSSGGVLEATLEARPAHIELGGIGFDGFTYNGIYAGPVLHARPGETMRIRLINGLAEPTNLHFHGIRTSPLANSDNAHVAVPPGQSFDYEVKISPEQTPGLYWYHSHIHGSAERQVMGGLSGALIVEGIEGNFPELAGIEQRLFVLKDVVDESDDDKPLFAAELHGIVRTINGATRRDLAMRPGETQLWRFSNQSANLPVRIAVADHRFRIIAEDGVPALRETIVDRLEIKPASRIEALIDAGAPGTYEVLALGTMTGTGETARQDRVLGALTVAGEPAANIASLARFPSQHDLAGARIDALRTIVFSQTKTLNVEEQKFFMNGRLYDPARIDIRVPLGHVEEWTVRNDSDDLHVFHIHQLSFQVMSVNGAARPFNGDVDVVRIPEHGEARLRLAFTDPTIVGRFFYHCHVLKHEDRGMMAQIEVYDPGAVGVLPDVGRFFRRLALWSKGVPWAYCESG
jgi:suppressor of ftsI